MLPVVSNNVFKMSTQKIVKQRSQNNGVTFQSGYSLPLSSLYSKDAALRNIDMVGNIHGSFATMFVVKKLLRKSDQQIKWEIPVKNRFSVSDFQALAQKYCFQLCSTNANTVLSFTELMYPSLWSNHKSQLSQLEVAMQNELSLLMAINAEKMDHRSAPSAEQMKAEFFVLLSRKFPYVILFIYTVCHCCIAPV